MGLQMGVRHPPFCVSEANVPLFPCFHLQGAHCMSEQGDGHLCNGPGTMCCKQDVLYFILEALLFSFHLELFQ